MPHPAKCRSAFGDNSKITMVEYIQLAYSWCMYASNKPTHCASSFAFPWLQHKCQYCSSQMQMHTYKCTHRPTLKLDLTVTSGVTRSWMARGSHSFTCHPHVYPRFRDIRDNLSPQG